MTDLRFSRRAFALGGLAGLLCASSLAQAKAQGSESIGFQANWLNDPEFIGYMIAIDNGYYAGAGLGVDYYPGGPDIMPEGALLTKKADIALTSMTSAAKAVGSLGGKLKIIGAQYQESPLGVISLEDRNIRSPLDLAGKVVAAPALAQLQLRTLLKVNNVDQRALRIVPYNFDPAPLLSGSVDAVVDFVTQLPFMIEKSGKKASSFLFYDFGLPFYINLLTVREETLEQRRDALIRFLRASRAAWEHNFEDPTLYPAKFQQSWFKGAGGDPDAAVYFNKTQERLMRHKDGFFSMDEAGIETNLKGLEKLGMSVDRSIFDPSLLAEL